MKKETFNKLEVDLYSEKLPNGLQVYIIPRENVNNIYVTLSTKYGSIHSEFVPINENKMIKVPDGIAHFLEHKAFEQSDGKDPFTFYSERGADANANTSHLKTTYLFSGPTFFEENLNYLLDYVQSPYFTKENVEKEKGIIAQEINMYKDNPFYVLYERSLQNTIVKHPLRVPIAGTIDSINKVTMDDLYICYNTFYHPSNMFLVIIGNVNPEEALQVVIDNQKNKTFEKNVNDIKIKKVKEPNEVHKEYEVIHMDVFIPKISINYKLNTSKSKLKKREMYNYLSIFLDLKFGETSEFADKMKKLQIISEGFGFEIIELDNHFIIMIMAETEKEEDLINYVKEEMLNFDIADSDFERKIKTRISSYIYISENIFQMNSKVMNNIVKDNKVNLDDYTEITNLNYQKFQEFIENLDFTNLSQVVIKK